MSSRNAYRIRKYGVRTNKFNKKEVWGIIHQDYPRDRYTSDYKTWHIFWGQPNGAIQFKSTDVSGWYRMYQFHTKLKQKRRYYTFEENLRKISTKERSSIMSSFKAYMIVRKLKLGNAA
jgi:hypothetical protein